MKYASNLITRIVETLTDGIVYGTSPMLTLVTTRDALRDLSARLETDDVTPRPVARDFQLVHPSALVSIQLPNQEHLESWNRQQVAQRMPELVTYVFDGKATTSKIYAIKYVRSRDGIGLREAKEYVEALPRVFADPKDITQ